MNDLHDAIDEALYDAVCDGEGRATAKHLEHHFAKRGLAIVPVSQAAALDACVKALETMLHTVCHETGFAAAVRTDSGRAYPWEPLDLAEAEARSALRAAKEARGK